MILLLSCVRVVQVDIPPSEIVAEAEIARRDCRAGSVVNVAKASSSQVDPPGPCDLAGLAWTKDDLRPPGPAAAHWSLDYTVPESAGDGELRGSCGQPGGLSTPLPVRVIFKCQQ